VFSELLTLNVGNALYVRRPEGVAGAKFGEARGAFSKAILVGTVRPGEQRPVLNPDPETVLEEEDRLVFLARSFEDCLPDSTRQLGVTVPASRALPVARERRRVLILGWSRKVPALLQEFQRYGKDVFEIDVVSATPIGEREQALARYASDAPGACVRQIEAGFTVPGVLERLEPRGYDNIVLLASERLGEQEQADATTALSYVMLNGLLPEDGPRPEMLLELLDEENEFLFSRRQEDVIVSPTLVSYVLSQVSMCRELAAVIVELSRPWGAQIVLRRAQEYVTTEGPVRFEDLECAAAARGEIAIGLRHAEGRDPAIALNPDRDTEWTLASADELVVLTTYAEPKEEA